jgi:hypothetical protein
MKNFLYNVFVKQTSIATYARFIFLAVSVLGLFGTLVASQGATGGSAAGAGASSAICLVFETVRNVIFLLGLTLMILGGALYAGANIMPSQSKGGFQGYGMAMIVGGVIGVAIAIAAPFVLGLLVTAGGANGVLGSTGTSGVNTLCTAVGAA